MQPEAGRVHAAPAVATLPVAPLACAHAHMHRPSPHRPSPVDVVPSRPQPRLCACRLGQSRPGRAAPAGRPAPLRVPRHRCAELTGQEGLDAGNGCALLGDAVLSGRVRGMLAGQGLQCSPRPEHGTLPPQSADAHPPAVDPPAGVLPAGEGVGELPVLHWDVGGLQVGGWGVRGVHGVAWRGVLACEHAHMSHSPPGSRKLACGGAAADVGAGAADTYDCVFAPCSVPVTASASSWWTLSPRWCHS